MPLFNSITTIVYRRPLKTKWPVAYSLLGLMLAMFSWLPLQAQQKLYSDSTANIESANIEAIAGISQDTTPHFTPHIYGKLLWSDMKQQLTAPFRAKKKDLVQLGELALFTVALSFADKPINRFATMLATNNPAIGTASNYITRFGGKNEVYTLAALGAYSVIGKNRKLANTTLLATQAYFTGGLIETGLKFLTGRQRPNYIDPITQRSSPVFHGPFYQYKKDANGFKPEGGSHSAFPSGHTTVAFAAATVFAMEYRDRPLVPVIAYSAATLIGLSRITENKHWPTDVLIGAALGFLSGQQVVNNFHKYFNTEKTPRPDKYKWKINATYHMGHLTPVAVLTF